MVVRSAGSRASQGPPNPLKRDGAGNQVFLRSRDWTENEGQGNNESADQASRDNPADVTCLYDHAQNTSSASGVIDRVRSSRVAQHGVHARDADRAIRGERGGARSGPPRRWRMRCGTPCVNQSLASRLGPSKRWRAAFSRVGTSSARLSSNWTGCDQPLNLWNRRNRGRWLAPTPTIRPNASARSSHTMGRCDTGTHPAKYEGLSSQASMNLADAHVSRRGTRPMRVLRRGLR